MTENKNISIFIIIAILLSFIVTIRAGIYQLEYVYVKYRVYGPVDITPFEKFKHTETALSKALAELSGEGRDVLNSAYDHTNKYLLINLQKTYYHYCGFTQLDWVLFKDTSNPDDYYSDHIRGNFDCRKGYVPKYD